MGLVAPLALVGLAALAIPVLIHLIQREKKRVVEFPSLTVGADATVNADLQHAWQ